MNTFVTIPHRFDAVVCLNGTIPSDEVFEHIMERPLIAADGAATQLFELAAVKGGYLDAMLEREAIQGE